MSKFSRKIKSKFQKMPNPSILPKMYIFYLFFDIICLITLLFNFFRQKMSNNKKKITFLATNTTLVFYSTTPRNIIISSSKKFFSRFSEHFQRKFIITALKKILWQKIVKHQIKIRFWPKHNRFVFYSRIIRNI